MSGTTVCHGALLRCSFGATPSLLATQHRGRGPSPALSFATVEDARPLMHILPFGACLSAAHPLAATGAAPCVPQTAGLWQIRAPSVRYEQVPALRSDATLLCEYGGVIAVVSPGQTTTRVSGYE